MVCPLGDCNVTSHAIMFRTLAVRTLNGTASERATNIPCHVGKLTHLQHCTIQQLSLMCLVSVSQTAG